MHNDSEEGTALLRSPVALWLSECSEAGATGWLSEYAELTEVVTLLNGK